MLEDYKRLAPPGYKWKTTFAGEHMVLGLKKANLFGEYIGKYYIHYYYNRNDLLEAIAVAKKTLFKDYIRLLALEP